MCATFTPVETHGKIVFIVFVVLVVTWHVSTFILVDILMVPVPEPYTVGQLLIDRFTSESGPAKKTRDSSSRAELTSISSAESGVRRSLRLDHLNRLIPNNLCKTHKGQTNRIKSVNTSSRLVFLTAISSFLIFFSYVTCNAH